MKKSKSKYFVLLQFIGGGKITEQNLMDSCNNETLHFGFRPKFDIMNFFTYLSVTSTRLKSNYLALKSFNCLKKIYITKRL